MQRKQTKRARRKWNEEDAEKSLVEIAAGSSIRKTAAKYGMSEGILRHRLKRISQGGNLKAVGRPITIDKDAEQMLAKCIGTMCSLGFSPTRAQIMDLVQDYVRNHDLKTPFRDDRPGRDWLSAFMNRNNLSLKKANMISSARKSATSNPFIIYDFYDVLEKLMREKKFKPEQVWNCDESGFPHDPLKCKVVSVKGKTAYKVTCGARRENTTTLAVCSAAGRVLDPLIVFSGKNLQSTWRGDRALPGTFYSISENGCMTTEVFAEWFNKFVALVTERPLLLIFDGHLTHVSIKVIEKAIEENVTILKLPPHVTDKLQPLDVACFGPLKREWEKTLNDWINVWGPKQTMKKSTFVNKLGEVWHKGLSPENVKAGFRATGIYPVDREKFPKDRLDRRLSKRYDQWAELGKPQDIMEQLATSIHIPQKAQPPPKDSTDNNDGDHVSISTPVATSTPGPSTEPASVTPVQSPTIGNECDCHNCKVLGPAPSPVPNRLWVPYWGLQESTARSTPTSEVGGTSRQSSKDFEELVLDKMKGPTDKPAVKRRKVDLKTKIVTDAEYLAELHRLKEEEGRKKEKKKKAKTGDKKKKTQ